MIYNRYMATEVDEIYEGWADAPERSRKKEKLLNVNSKTAKQIRRGERQRGRENRRARAGEQLRRTVEHLANLQELSPEEDYLDAYASWVAQSRTQGYPQLDKNDVDPSSTTPTGHGGQHKDHKRTARELFHILTHIEVVSADRVGGQVNSERAFERMYERLADHLKIWDEILPKKITEPEIKARVLTELQVVTTLIQQKNTLST